MQIFHRSSNALARISILALVFLVAFGFWVLAAINQSPFATRQDVFTEQPVPFSHQHHVTGLGIDCRYCHTSVETSSFAGIPPISTCMNCHKQIWTNAQLLEPIRNAFRTGVPIQWIRVNQLPDYVQFNHSIHINKGIGCVSCHGRVDLMPLTYQAQPLTMGWCLSCHKHPENFIRPKDRVFDLAWKPGPKEPQSVLGPKLVKLYNVKSKTNCSTCHY
ncbi:MAG: cytochrome c3 family protein [Thermoanaerobaculia bacterium]